MWKSLTSAIALRPALGAVGGCVAGCVLGQLRLPLATAAAGVAAVAGAAWILVAARRRGTSARPAAILAIFAAYLAWSLCLSARRERAMSLLFPDPDAPSARIEFSGIVGSDIEARPLRNGGMRYTFTVAGIRPVADDDNDGAGASPAVRALSRHGAPAVRAVWFGHRPAEGEPRPVPQAGERWVFRGKAKPVGRAASRRRIELTTRSDDSRRLAPAGRGNGRALVAALRAESSRRLALGLDAPEKRDAAAMAQAILLGYRNDIPARLNRVFRDSGSMHVFAISGMHVMIVAAFLTMILGRFGVPRTRWFPVVCPALVLYTAITGGQPSAVRACLMACLYLAAPLFGRRPDGPSALAIAAICLLAWNPAQIADAGFLLSFTVVASLIALATPLARILRSTPLARRLDEDDRMLWKLGGETPAAARWLARLLRLAYRYLADLLAVSVVAWMASAPLTAWYFQRLTPAAIVANLAVVPLAMAVVVGGCLSLLAASVAAPAAALLNQVPAGAASLMARVAHAAAAVPWLVCRVPQPPEWAIAAWYLALAFSAWLLRRHIRDTGEASVLPY